MTNALVLSKKFGTLAHIFISIRPSCLIIFSESTILRGHTTYPFLAQHNFLFHSTFSTYLHPFFRHLNFHWNSKENQNKKHYFDFLSSQPTKHRAQHIAATNSKVQSERHMPSRWYTVLALPFPEIPIGRRDISTFGRGVYTSRAGFFSNPLWVEANNNTMCHSNSQFRSV